MIAATCALAAQLALAQSVDPAPATGQLLAASGLNGASLAVGDAVLVAGKYRELLGSEVKLYDCDVPFRIEQNDLRRRFRELQAQRDNVILRGTVVAAGAELRPGHVAVVVEEVQRGPGDVSVFGQLLEAATRGEPAAAALEDLLRRITVSYQRFPDAELIPLFRGAFTAHLRRPAAPGGETAARAFEALRDLHAAVGQKALTLELAQLLLADPAAPAQLPELLLGIGCRQSRGRWVTYEELKAQEGFVLHEGAWVQPREKHLAEVLARLGGSRQPLFVLRKRTDREYQHLAAKGTIEEGMKPEEVSQALGFPDRVERRLFEQKELNQWSYGATYCYFYDGLLFKPPEKP